MHRKRQCLDMTRTCQNVVAEEKCEKAEKPVAQ